MKVSRLPRSYAGQHVPSERPETVKERDWYVLQQWLGGRSLADIAREFGISRNRVVQLRTRAFQIARPDLITYEQELVGTPPTSPRPERDYMADLMEEWRSVGIGAKCDPS